MQKKQIAIIRHPKLWMFHINAIWTKKKDGWEIVNYMNDGKKMYGSSYSVSDKDADEIFNLACAQGCFQDIEETVAKKTEEIEG